jgi:hypothetical protein
VFEADPDAYLNLNDEVDKYYDYNDAISKAEKSLDKLSKTKERTYGAAYLNALDQEIKGI